MMSDFTRMERVPQCGRAAVVLSWSGGKDSALALEALRKREDVEVVALLTSVTSGYDRISIHGVRRTLLARQAESLGLPLITVELTPACSNADYEAAFLAGLERLSAAHPEVKHIAFGDLYLTDVREYRDRLLAGTRFTGMYPLWNEPTAKLAEHFIDAGFAATLVCVDTTQIDGAFAGRSFDRSLLNELPATCDPCGENGEFHTFVHVGPIFPRAIPVERGEIVLREGRFTYCDLLLPNA
jgi:uncharacterized protein (TIGR00290 family)